MDLVGKSHKAQENKFEGYLIQFYTDKNAYQLHFIEKNEVSGNSLITLNTISPYDNFIATLVMTDLYRSGYVLKDRIKMDALKHLFTSELFDNITYEIAPNKVRRISEPKTRNLSLKTPSKLRC